MMRVKVDLTEAARIGPTDRQSERLDAARAWSRRRQALAAAAGDDVPERRWYVLTVQRGMESSVDISLDRDAVAHWLPLVRFEQKPRKGRKGPVPPARTEIAWPGYMFILMHATDHAFDYLATVDGVRGMLCAGGRPTPVRDENVSRYKWMLEHDRAAFEELSALVRLGEKVRIESGPFASFPAEVVAAIGERVTVEVMLFGRVVPVELELAQITRSR